MQVNWGFRGVMMVITLNIVVCGGLFGREFQTIFIQSFFLRMMINEASSEWSYLSTDGTQVPVSQSI